MSDELSIVAAAASHGSCDALLHEGRGFTYCELAQQCAEIKLPKLNLHRVGAGLHTPLLLYKSLEARKPLIIAGATISDTELARFAERLPERLSDEVALVIFTSGSEGEAKGVKLSRRALLASAHASRQMLTWFGADRWLCALPLSHIGGLSILLRCLVDRKTALLCDGFDAKEVAATICNEKVTHISLVPTMLWRLLEIDFRPPPHLQLTLMGGAALDAELAHRARNAGFVLRASYGMTETASQIINEGRALAGVELRVRDARLEIKGPMLMDGYLPPHQPEELGGDKWFLTQDLAEIDEDGAVRILGRADELIISGGENIDPRKVEAKLNQTSAIAASFALGLPHSEWGQELVALVVPSSPHWNDEDLQAHSLRGHLRPKLLVAVEALPLLASGKIDRGEARRIATADRNSRHKNKRS